MSPVEPPPPGPNPPPPAATAVLAVACPIPDPCVFTPPPPAEPDITPVPCVTEGVRCETRPRIVSKPSLPPEQHRHSDPPVARQDAPVPDEAENAGGYLPIAEAALNAGFTPNHAITAVAVAAAESQLDPQAHNGNRATGDNSYGYWQINMIDQLGVERRARWGLASNDELFDPRVNARAAFDLSGGGGDWSPWSVWRKGLHRTHLEAARQAVETV